MYHSPFLLGSILGSWRPHKTSLMTDPGASWGLEADQYLREMIFLPLSQSRLLPETWTPEFLK